MTTDEVARIVDEAIRDTREACAKIAEEIAERGEKTAAVTHTEWVRAECVYRARIARDMARAIRASGD